MRNHVKLAWSIGVPTALLAVFIAMIPLIVGINDSGHRTVVQWPNGNVFVKFEPGMYVQAFGKYWEYNDVITYDFDNTKESVGTIGSKGIEVRYRDGGMGWIYGKARFTLPQDEESMLLLHKETRSNLGVAHKIIKSITDEAIVQTAGLMNSSEGYDSKRAIFTQQAREQLSSGLYKTKVELKVETDKITNKTVTKKIPVPIVGDDGRYVQHSSDLKQYGITVTGFQLNNPGFEKTTVDQISEQRQATMAIITAKATAEKAKQDKITAEAKGQANVMKAKYEREVEKEKAIVEAQQIKEVATIRAQQKVAVAKEATLEAREVKFKAEELKQAHILEGEGLAEKKRLIMTADGALEQKLHTYERVMISGFKEMGKQKWVPEIQFGSTEGTTGDSMNQFMSLLSAKAAKDLGVDMTITTK